MSDLPTPVSAGRSSSSSVKNASPGVAGGHVTAKNPSLQTSMSVGSLTKEHGPAGNSEAATFAENVTDVEVTPELARAGVVKRSERMELPPDVAQMGVTAVGPGQPMTQVATIQLPLTDEQIMVGLHAQILSSVRWLSEWCVRRLKQVHVHLKNLGGKVVREKE